MKILLVSDHEDDMVWNHWDRIGRKRYEGVSLILSAGDIRADYLEFLVTMTCVPLLYIRGNHDDAYEDHPPEGCICIEDGIIELAESNGSGVVMTREDAIRRGIGNDCRIVRVAGLGGSMRYRDGRNMYTEREMAARVRRLRRRLLGGVVLRPGGRRTISRDLAEAARSREQAVDILLTHAPCRGYGDLDDIPHQGFACFNDLLTDMRPAYHCYGHVHMEYGRIGREMEHPSGTRLINVSGEYILEI